MLPETLKMTSFSFPFATSNLYHQKEHDSMNKNPFDAKPSIRKISAEIVVKLTQFTSNLRFNMKLIGSLTRK